VSWEQLSNLDLKVRPLERWPEPVKLDRRRRRSPFSAPWGSTRSLLLAELRHLEARSPILELAVKPGDLRRDGMPYARTVADHPGVVLTLPASVHGPLRYFTDEFDRWQDNLRAVALSLEALRRVDRYGVARRGEQYRGWTALPSGLEFDAQLERGRRLIAEAGGYANALKRHHPDHGGSAEDAVAILAAREADGA